MKKIYIIIFILISIYYFEEDIKDIKIPSSITVLVNKKNRLPKNYKPINLYKLPVDVSNDNKYLVNVAAKEFISLSRDAKKLGYKIYAVSTYRDYEYQKNLFNHYVKTKGYYYAIRCSAKPGHSEHQTGLAVDVAGTNLDYNIFDKSKEFKWMKNNAHKYGFILRYPKNKEYITGFKYEPWHYRYVGRKIAKYIYENNITLEEYKNN